MRVIGGKAKGRKLKRVPGDTTRPITDRVKENLFNILGDATIGTRWLDLFAGTGQVGIEALSRGAREAVFIDLAPAAVRTTRENLQLTGLTGRATVVRRDAFAYLTSKVSEPFDVIFVAPPQYRKMWVNVLKLLDQDWSHYLSERGLVVVQLDPTEYAEIQLNTLRLTDQRRYGSTMLLFYET